MTTTEILLELALNSHSFEDFSRQIEVLIANNALIPVGLNDISYEMINAHVD